MTRRSITVAVGPCVMGFCILCTARAKVRLWNVATPAFKVEFCQSCAETAAHLLAGEALDVDPGALAQFVDAYHADIAENWDDR